MSHVTEISVEKGRKTSDVITELVTNGSIELSNPDPAQIAAGARLLPYGTSVYVPSPAKKRLASTLEVLKSLHEAGLEAVPHVAARKLESRLELKDYLDRAVNEFGVHRVLVIGGDVAQAAGPYADGLSLLRDDVLVDAGIKEIGIAGYPEGHPRIPPAVIDQDLKAKLRLARDRNLGIEVVTQFSFAPTRISEYCAVLSREAPNVPVYVGIAGPTSTANLVRYASYCGVSSSLRALTDMGLKAAKRLAHTDPDKQIVALARHCGLRRTCNVIGVHTFSFGGFKESAEWMRRKCRRPVTG
jgi:methylenetetrahydrofolate reductase (NADPH)